MTCDGWSNPAIILRIVLSVPCLNAFALHKVYPSAEVPIKSAMTSFDVTALKGGDVVVNCTVHGAKGRVGWTFDGRNAIYADAAYPPLSNRFESSYRSSSSSATASMRISQPIYTDTGNYTCSAGADSSRSVFIFIDDGVASHSFMKPKARKAVIPPGGRIPCVLSTLYYEEVRLLDLLGNTILASYDPALGFKTEADFKSQNVTCEVTRVGSHKVSDTQMIEVIVMRPTSPEGGVAEPPKWDVTPVTADLLHSEPKEFGPHTTTIAVTLTVSVVIVCIVGSLGYLLRSSKNRQRLLQHEARSLQNAFEMANSRFASVRISGRSTGGESRSSSQHRKGYSDPTRELQSYQTRPSEESTYAEVDSDQETLDLHIEDMALPPPLPSSPPPAPPALSNNLQRSENSHRDTCVTSASRSKVTADLSRPSNAASVQRLFPTTVSPAVSSKPSLDSHLSDNFIPSGNRPPILGFDNELYRQSASS